MIQVIEIDTQDGYNLWSETYDSTGNPLVATENGALDEMLETLQGKRAVDLGCGTGRNTRKLSALGADVIGMDFSEGMLKKARESSNHFTSVRYLQHDLNRRLPFNDDEFDAVVCSLVIEHIQNLTPVFQEMKRICKPSGYIVVSDLHPTMRLKDAQAQFTDKKTGQDIRPIGYPHSMSEYVLSIQEAGLMVAAMKEFCGREDLVSEFPKMKKYVNWPMLVMFKLRK